jgi:hypothetical protein
MSLDVQFMPVLKIDFVLEQDWSSLVNPYKKTLVLNDNFSDCIRNIGKFLKIVASRFETVIIVMGEDTSIKEQKLLVEVAFGPQNVYILGTNPLIIKELVFVRPNNLSDYKHSDLTTDLVIITQGLEERRHAKNVLETLNLRGPWRSWY